MASAEMTLGTAVERERHVSLFTHVKRHPMAIMGVGILAFLALTAIVGPFIIPYDPQSIEFNSFMRPSLSHPFGTDLLGRDVLTRVIYGARISLGIGVAATAIASIGGTLLGVFSAYFGGWVDYTLQRLIEVIMCLPNIILLIVLAAVLGPSIRNVILILGVAAIPIMSRLVRSIVLSEKQQPYIEAARSLGATNWRILFVHVLPSTFPLAAILASLSLGAFVLAEAGLSFLGLGVPVPNPSWGADMSGNARSYFQQAPWLAIFPGLAISITILGANLVGEAVRDIIDPFSQSWGGAGRAGR
jgi:peptide/nickel transport system permease protein